MTTSLSPAGPVPSDVQLITDLAATVTGADPLRGLFDVRFPIGVRLRNATPGSVGSVTGAQWLMDTAPNGPGWQPLGSWEGLGTVARRAGRGGLTLLWFSAGSGSAQAVHNARDGEQWLFHVRPGEPPKVVRLAQVDRHGQEPPVAAATIDWCAEVRVEEERA